MGPNHNYEHPLVIKQINEESNGWGRKKDQRTTASEP
uniref:Uncharacterized protein n=1 Tax=Arundo donax TaxID=35708 RepID=A0A0A9GSF0_ARUDO